MDPHSVPFLTLRANVLFLLDTHPTSYLVQVLTQSLAFDPDSKKSFLLMKKIKQLDKIKMEGNESFQSGRLEEALIKYQDYLDVEAGGMDGISGGFGGVGRVKVLSNRATVQSKVSHPARFVRNFPF